jgi:2-hydroxychromene-2-carboxylate isomerase
MIEFFFDCSSPWTYLAFHNIQPLAAELGEEISWRPILVGGVFNAVNPSVYDVRANPIPQKTAYSRQDMQKWAEYSGIEIRFPPTIFPLNSVKAMRGCVWLQRHDRMVDFATEVFRAYWGNDQDISNDEALATIADKLGIDRQAFFLGISDQTVKDQLRANADELIRRGGFGSPTFFLDETDMYFGNDRLPLLRAAILRRLRNSSRLPNATIP